MLTVKDKGDHNLGNTDLTEVEITLLPNLWITPDPVEVIENDVPDSPILKVKRCLSQIRSCLVCFDDISNLYIPLFETELHQSCG